MKNIILILTMFFSLQTFSQNIDYSKDYITVFEQLMKNKMYEDCFNYISLKLDKELLKAKNEAEIKTEIINKENNTILFYKYENNKKVAIDTTQGEYAEYAKYSYILDSTTVADCYYKLALIKTEQNKIDEAILFYEKAINFNNKSERYYADLSSLYFDYKKDNEKGLEILSKGIKTIEADGLLKSEVELLKQLVKTQKALKNKDLALKEQQKLEKEIEELKKKISELK